MTHSRLTRLLLSAWMVALASSMAFAQTPLIQARLNLELDPRNTKVTLADASDVVVGDVLYVDREAMRVTGVSGQIATVARASLGTAQVRHEAGSPVYSGPAAAFATADVVVGAACVAGTYTPRIHPASGQIVECTNDVWVTLEGTAPLVTIYPAPSITGGSGGAPEDARYVTATANSTLTNEVNLGALATGWLKLSVAGGTATPSTASGIVESDFGFTDITTANASSLAHGLLPKLANTGTRYLRDDGTWQVVAGGGATDNPTFTGVVTLDGQYYSPMMPHAAAGTTETINWNDSNEHRVVLDENVTFTFSNPLDGGRYLVLLVQDPTGGNTVTWPASVEWAGGVTPTVTATGDAKTLCAFLYDGTASKYRGACDTSAGSGGGGGDPDWTLDAGVVSPVDPANAVSVPIFVQPLYAGGNATGSVAVNWNNGNRQKFTLTGNTTFTFANPLNGAAYTLLITQDSTARTVTWPTSVLWPRGVPPSISAGSGDVDLCTFVYMASSSKYYGACSQQYTATPVNGPFDATLWVANANAAFPNAVVMSSTAPAFTTSVTTPILQSASNADIEINPNGTGKIKLVGQAYNPTIAHSAAGTTETIDWNEGNVHRVILDENVTLTLSNPVDGGRYVVYFVQDGTGGNTVTWPSSAVLWPAATAPTITTTSNVISACVLIYDGTLTKYIGMCNLDIR